MVAFLFPGQGSQQKGMGGTLFERFPTTVEQADEILGFSIKSLCLEDPKNQLLQTRYTQPALYTVNALQYFDKLQAGYSPDYVAGHSLGEYNALLAADVFDFATGLRLVKKRAELMSQVSGGAMAAVIGFDVAYVADCLRMQNLTTIDIANDNTPNQVVITGMQADIDSAMAVFEQQGAMMVLPLNVSGAFHSRYMQSAQAEFSSFLQSFKFQPPRLPVIANVNGKPYKPSAVYSNLAQQITQTVCWTDTIHYLTRLVGHDFEEIGPGEVLTSLLRHIL